MRRLWQSIPGSALVAVGSALMVFGVALGVESFDDHRPAAPATSTAATTSTTLDVYRNLRRSVDEYCQATGRGRGHVDTNGNARCDR